MYFVYILRCADNSVYTGITTDLKRRFTEHLSGNGAKYTKVHKVLGVEAVWETNDKINASKLEYHIKQLSKNKKEELILKKFPFSDISDKLNSENYKRLTKKHIDKLYKM